MNDFLNPAKSADVFVSNAYGPLTAGQMLERTATMLRENFKLFAGIVLVVIGVEIVVGGLLAGTSMWTGHLTAGTAPVMKLLYIVPLAMLGGFVIYVFAQIVQGALFVATQARLACVEMTVGEACRVAADKVGRLIGISILVGLRMMGYAILFYAALAIPLVMVLFVAGMAQGAGGNPFQIGHLPSAGMGIFLIVFLLVALVLYVYVCLWLVARYAVSIPAALAENLPVTEAIRRSIHLTRKSKGRLYALFLVIALVYFLLAAATLPVQFITVRAVGQHTGMTVATMGMIFIGLSVLKILVSAVVIAFMGVATTLCYFELRVRKEGFGGTPVVVSAPVGIPPLPVSEPPIEDLPIS